MDSTVRDAMFRDYLCVLLADCMSEPIGYRLPRSNHDASLLSAEMALGLGLGLGTDPESRPAIIETRAVGKVGVPRGTEGLPFLFSTPTAKQVLERLCRDLRVLGVLF